MTKYVSAAVLAALLTAGSVVVAEAAQAPAKARSAASIECSKQADAKGLHGKVRKKFRSKCLKDMKKAA
jgi:hypothetical protein